MYPRCHPTVCNWAIIFQKNKIECITLATSYSIIHLDINSTELISMSYAGHFVILNFDCGGLREEDVKGSVSQMSPYCMQLGHHLSKK